nr:coatomer subunit zeta-1-like [Tanacetum cinerariifolium]
MSMNHSCFDFGFSYEEQHMVMPGHCDSYLQKELNRYISIAYLLPGHVGSCSLRITYSAHTDLNINSSLIATGDNENELIISTVLQGFFDEVGLLLRGNVDKKEALENLDLILLFLDEIVDGGIILETDANVIAGKVASHSVDSRAPLSEQVDFFYFFGNVFDPRHMRISVQGSGPEDQTPDDHHHSSFLMKYHGPFTVPDASRAQLIGLLTILTLAIHSTAFAILGAANYLISRTGFLDFLRPWLQTLLLVHIQFHRFLLVVCVCWFNELHQDPSSGLHMAWADY